MRASQLILSRHLGGWYWALTCKARCTPGTPAPRCLPHLNSCFLNPSAHNYFILWHLTPLQRAEHTPAPRLLYGALFTRGPFLGSLQDWCPHSLPSFFCLHAIWLERCELAMLTIATAAYQSPMPLTLYSSKAFVATVISCIFLTHLYLALLQDTGSQRVWRCLVLSYSWNLVLCRRSALDRSLA